MNRSMFFFKIFKCCLRGDANDSEVLPLVRIASPQPMPMGATSHLPVSSRPIPQLDVSVSSSTSVAMFEHESIGSMRSSHNSFTSNDTFEDVDLSLPTKFSDPSKTRKVIFSPFDDQHKLKSTLSTPGYTNYTDNTEDNEDNEDNEVSDTSLDSSNAPLVPAK
jgi:hypothetical protein